MNSGYKQSWFEMLTKEKNDLQDRHTKVISDILEIIEEMRSYGSGIGFRTKADEWADRIEGVIKNK